jgi:hypothetical protein
VSFIGKIRPEFNGFWCDLPLGKRGKSTRKLILLEIIKKNCIIVIDCVNLRKLIKRN